MKIKILLILVAFFIIFGGTSNATTKIYVYPPSINQGYNIGDIFPINVKLDQVSDLAGFEFKLYWDPAVLRYDHDDLVVGSIWPGYYTWKRESNNTAGYYYVGFSKDSLSNSFSGSGTLAVAYLKVLTMGASVLDLKYTKLGNSSALPIYHQVEDGLFNITTTTIKPQTSTTIRSGGGCGRGCYMLGLSSDLQFYFIEIIAVMIILVAMFGIFKLFTKKK